MSKVADILTTLKKKRVCSGKFFKLPIKKQFTNGLRENVIS